MNDYEEDISSLEYHIISERDRKAKPTKREIEEATSIIEDFGVTGFRIPSFKTRAELERWKKEMINRAFDDSL